MDAVALDLVAPRLRRYKQWVCWRAAGTRKVPYSPYGQRVSTTNRGRWVDLDEAANGYLRYGWDGIGIVLSHQDNLVGIDLDNCIPHPGGSPEPWAREILDATRSYAEVSPSRRGIKTILRLRPGTHLPEPIRVHDARMGVYSEGQFFTITGWMPPESAAHNRTVDPEVIVRIARQAGWTPGVRAGRRAVGHAYARSGQTIPDHELVERALAARNGHRFEMLMDGDWEGAGYPSWSQGEIALLDILAFWSPDPQQIERSYRSSLMYRPSWDHRAPAEIAKARTWVKDSWQPRSDASRVFDYLRRRGAPARVCDIAEVVGCSLDSAWIALTRYTEAGDVVRIGRGLYAPAGWEARLAPLDEAAGLVPRELEVGFDGGDVTNSSPVVPSGGPGVYAQIEAALHDAGGPLDDDAIAAALGRVSGPWLRTALHRLVRAGRVVRVPGRRGFYESPGR